MFYYNFFQEWPVYADNINIIGLSKRDVSDAFSGIKKRSVKLVLVVNIPESADKSVYSYI